MIPGTGTVSEPSYTALAPSRPLLPTLPDMRLVWRLGEYLEGEVDLEAEQVDRFLALR